MKPERNRAGGGRLENVSGDLLVRRFTVRQPEMYRVVERVSAEKRTAIPLAALCELAQTAMDVEFEGLSGDFLQAGCGLGGAAIVIAYAKRRSRALTVHDPFDGADGEKLVRAALEHHRADERLNVRLVAGSYGETLAADGEVAFAHLDCGEREAVRVSLERLVPRLVPGGRLIIDDYKSKEECRRAVDDYFRGRSGFRIESRIRLHVIRSAE